MNKHEMMTEFKNDTNSNSPNMDMDYMSLSSFSSYPSVATNRHNIQKSNDNVSTSKYLHNNNSMSGFVDVSYDKPNNNNNKYETELTLSSTQNSINELVDIAYNNFQPLQHIPESPFISTDNNKSPYIVDESQYASLNMIQWNSNHTDVVNTVNYNTQNIRSKLPITPKIANHNKLLPNQKSECIANTEVEHKESDINSCLRPTDLKISTSISNLITDNGVIINENVSGSLTLTTETATLSTLQITPDSDTPQTTQTTLPNIDSFENDMTAYNIWILCCNFDKTLCIFDNLFVELLKIWKQETKCERLPTNDEIKPIFVRFGGETVDNIYLVIKQKKFMKFWKWFKNCCYLMNDIKHLWDSFELPLFCDRKYTEKLLNKSYPGTFILRISATLASTLIISYVNSTTITIDSKTTVIKHIALTRDSKNNTFIIHKSSAHKPTNLAHLIRSFIKLKHVRVSHNKIYPKNVIF